jgi:hypothetical protein
MTSRKTSTSTTVARVSFEHRRDVLGLGTAPTNLVARANRDRRVDEITTAREKALAELWPRS